MDFWQLLGDVLNNEFKKGKKLAFQTCDPEGKVH